MDELRKWILCYVMGAHGALLSLIWFFVEGEISTRNSEVGDIYADLKSMAE